jgi:general secretion pathway protein G
MMKSVLKKSCRPRQAQGFSLIELLVVLVILGLLAGLVGPNVLKWIGSANTDTARTQIEQLSGALDLYRLEVGRYPNSSEGLEALVAQPSGVDRWNGPYLQKNSVPKDPWGNEYQYRAPGENGPFDLFSLGADGVDGGDGENQDVASWQ